MREQDGMISAHVAEGVCEDRKIIAGDDRSPVAPGRKGLFALLSGIACTVFGSRLIVIWAFGSPVPVLDQWDGEGAALYSPYLRGALSFSDLIAPHNGHRILITRLFALAHLELAGEWNTRLEMIFGAAILTAFVTWLAALLMPLVARDRQLLLACFVALVFAFPIDYENTLWGFQSQVYLSLLSGLAALAAVASATPFSPRWFAGLAAGVFAYFTFATGVAALVAAVLLVSLQLATNSRRRCGREIAAVAVLASIAVGLTLWGAESAATMSTLWTFAAGLSIFAALTLAAAIPIILFCRHILIGRPGLTDRAWVMPGLAIWVTIQLVLFAYGRGIHVAPRYMGVVLLAYVLALVAVLELPDRAQAKELGGKVRLRPRIWVFTVVGAIVVAGWVSVLASSFWAKAADQQLADVRAYLATGSVDHLNERGSPTHGIVLNHPYPEREARTLGDPVVRAILPPEIRPSDADNVSARQHMLLRGMLATTTAIASQLVFVLSPGVLALGLAMLYAVGRAQRLRPEDSLQQLRRDDRVSSPLTEDSE